LVYRTDGLALLAEGLASDHASGRFREFMRLFERAFATDTGKLLAPLRQFLDPRFGHTEKELATWIRLRQAVSRR
jgi:hypothetical protein